MKKIPLLALALCVMLQPVFRTVAAEAYYSPRLAAETGGGLWLTLQSSDAPGGDAPPAYELFRTGAPGTGWERLGAFNGAVAGLGAGGGELWLAIQDGTLVRHGDGGAPAISGNGRWNLAAAAWFEETMAAVNYRDRALTFLLAGKDGWREEGTIASESGRLQAKLVELGGELHLFWTVFGNDLSSGTVRHAIRRNGAWNEEKSLALGPVSAFTAFSSPEGIRLAAAVADPLGRDRPGGEAFLRWNGGVWEDDPAAERILSGKLGDAYGIDAVMAGPSPAWVLTGATGAFMLLGGAGGGAGEFAVSRASPGNAGLWIVFLFFLTLVMMALMVFRATKKAWMLARRFPGVPADLFTRGVAFFVDAAVASLGAAAYHLLSGDVNIYLEFLSVERAAGAFWINLAFIVAYMTVLEAVFGRTPGKYLMAIRVRSAGGGRASFLQTLLRNLLRAVDMYPAVFPGVVGVLVAMFNRRRQRLGDLAGATLVLRHAPLTDRDVVLASASPRRKELLEALGLSFAVVPATINEQAVRGDNPLETARLLAEAKARDVGRRLESGAVVIAADTMVVVDGASWNKPADAADAKRMLSGLSGRSHVVVTGVAVLDAFTGQMLSSAEQTEVEFNVLSEERIDAYVATGEPMDKAGSYGVQGGAGVLIKQVRGSLSNVVGLPMELLQSMFEGLDS